MFGAVMRFVGLVRVSAHKNQIVISGLPGDLLARDVTKMWASGRVTNNLFTKITRSHITFNRFFLIEVVFILEQLYHSKQRTQTSKRLIKAAIDELMDKTWLKELSKQKNHVPRLNLKHLDKFHKTPLSHQAEFFDIYNTQVDQFHLNGYMLAAKAGSGKTLTQLMVSECREADVSIIVVPKNSVVDVWEKALRNEFKNPPTYWHSLQGTPAEPGMRYYIFHYESLEAAIELAGKLAGTVKKVYVGLDESHNFNTRDSLRTNLFIQLCRILNVTDVIWASGTPIKALGFETIPFLITVVRSDFDADAEARFRKIFGKDAKRANDILRHRIGLMSYKVTDLGSMENRMTIEEIKISIPNANKYTLLNLKEMMRDYITERSAYYKQHFERYETVYKQGLAFYEKTIRTAAEKEDFKRYKASIKMISGGYDPRSMKEEAIFCNRFELKTIMPVLPAGIRKEFKGARSVIKYVELKIVGEALGNVLGKQRTQCHVDMVDYMPLEAIIDNAKKKTLIFSSYVEVVKKIVARLVAAGYRPVEVHGETNKNLPALVKQFFTDPDANPCVATFQSLSTAVPMIAANTEIMTNAPYRDGEREQAIARVNRIGQDEDVWIFDLFLDTGNEPNISTRSKDILEWSKAQVSAILGHEIPEFLDASMEGMMMFADPIETSDNTISAIHKLYDDYVAGRL